MGFLRVVLLPFSWLYDLVTRLRNYLYDSGYKTSFEFDTCTIAVGNLTVGGTGKSPMVEYLIRLLSDSFRLTTLSRGYGRKTKGFRLASEEDNYLTIGDEPIQFYKKFKQIGVSVGEERAVAIPFILAERPETQIILLDDAFQHRAVKPNLNLLLTDFNRPFFNDDVLPAGRLREARKGVIRAQAIIVTKCPPQLEKKRRQEFVQSIRRYYEGPVFFSFIRYLQPKAIFSNSNSFSSRIFLFTGIANPRPLRRWVESAHQLVGEMHFGDHHAYTVQDIESLLQAFDRLSESDACLLTTEKDMVKLLSKEIADKMKEYPVYYLPIEMDFIENGKQFDDMVLETVNSLVI